MLLLLLMVLGGIYMYMLFQGAAGNCVVPHMPEMFFRLPLSTCRLDLCPQGHVRGCDVKGVQEYPAPVLAGQGVGGSDMQVCNLLFRLTFLLVTAVHFVPSLSQYTALSTCY